MNVRQLICEIKLYTTCIRELRFWALKISLYNYNFHSFFMDITCIASHIYLLSTLSGPAVLSFAECVYKSIFGLFFVGRFVLFKSGCL